ncbi:MAG: citramalate synthase, partial [Alphaproteobacteria bacterium]|nr:citramalate synthase [Alphaproteobacteria bacterium]
MSDDRLYLFDTTLRDGAQTQGVDFNVADKAAIARDLDALGIDYVEGGWPGANPTDDGFFADPPALSRARLTAFGMTRRAGRSAANDPGLAVTLRSRVDTICLVGKSDARHAESALGVSLDENLAMIRDSIAEIVRRGKEALFDAEHFFDGYKARPDYALKVLETALEAGARWVVLCDTNGGTLPDEIEAAVASAAQAVPGARLGIHTHNDTGNAVANTLAAVGAGGPPGGGTQQSHCERCRHPPHLARQ